MPAPVVSVVVPDPVVSVVVPAPVVSVVVPAHNAEATLGATLAGLTRQDLDAPFEVIVVDSASTDGTRALAGTATRADPRVRVLENPGGEPAGSRTRGVQAAAAPVIAFTDADCVPDPGWLRVGLDALAAVDLLQGRVLPAGPHRVWDRTLSVGHESGLYETANLFVRRDLILAVGGFRPFAGPGAGRPFGEDTVFAWRARRTGAQTGFCAGAVVRHAVIARPPGAYVLEQRRRARFPALVAEVPELRRAFLHRRIFLSPATARFDLALVGVLSAAARRRPVALLAAVPYLLGLPREPVAALVQSAADGVGALGLVAGSLRARTLVL